MRYICEFAGADDSLLIRDLADDLAELEDVLINGTDILGPMIHCYSLEPAEVAPRLGIVKRKAKQVGEQLRTYRQREIF